MKYILTITALLGLGACQNNKTHTERTATDSSLSINNVNDSVLIHNSPKTHLYKDSLKYKTVSFYKETKKSSLTNDSNNFAYVKAHYPKFASDQSFLNKRITSIITSEPWTGKQAKSIEAATASFFKDYYSFKKEAPDSPAGYEWNTNLSVSFQDTNLVVLTNDSYFYTGGAHGLENIIYYNLDVKNGKDLVLKDLLIPNYKSKLTAVAEIIFRKNEGLSKTEPLTSYFFENQKFVINDNFAITQKGLMFTYNPYEIKSYAEGITHLLIPYAQITDLIKSDSFISKLINK